MTKQITLSLILLSFLVLSVSLISACDYNDDRDCEVTKTIVKGKVYFEDTNQSAGKADVTIICNHNGTEYTRTTKTLNYGNLKGTYFVLFPQSECIAGDEVTVSAVKNDLSGQEDSTIKNWIDKRCLDIDIGIINVPLVPEFGIIVGSMTLIGAVALFFLVRRS